MQHIDNETGEGQPEAQEDYDPDMYAEEAMLNGEILEMPGPGELTCYCSPTTVYGCKDFFTRTGLWFLINKEQLLNGITASILQCHEAVTFAIIAGIDPTICLQSTWIIGLLASIIGGRPGTISGFSFASAVIVSKLAKDHSMEYVFYAVMLAGILQALFGVFKCGKIMRVIPYPVIVGFTNAIAIVLAVSQVSFFQHQDLSSNEVGKVTGSDFHVELGLSLSPLFRLNQWLSAEELIVMGAEVGLGFIICLFLPKLTRAVPSSLVAIVVVTIAEYAIVQPLGYQTKMLLDFAEIKQIYPMPVLIDPKYVMPSISLETLRIVYVPAISIAAISLFESLMTISIVDELTDSRGNRNREAFGQGLGQFASGILGGVSGSAVVGQTLLNMKNQGYTRLSSFIAPFFVMIWMFGAAPAINHLPVSGFVACMLNVICHTYDWSSMVIMIAGLMPQAMRNKLNIRRKVARADCFTILAVIAVILLIDLATAVAIGTCISLLMYTWDSGMHIRAEREITEEEDLVTYTVTGPLFFGSVLPFEEMFPIMAVQEDPTNVMIVLEETEVFDWSGMVSLKSLHDRLLRLGKNVKFSYITQSSKRLMEKSSRMWEDVHFMNAEEVDIEDEMIEEHM
uniref:STAS domain-containing protein n=1 Tax=Corethron hystrix TaxID=216773 RepID=A0A7S1BBL7_9STRA|mmetsp:Transcript_20328/g.46114  ORF Transcript_20328/g.46114 Transcript_20328/m.46114 type:complete len:624 (+) Transcript_20328:102-1973(+)